MKYYFKGLIILLFDDLEIQWNLRMEEIEVGLEEEEPQSLNQSRISDDEEEELKYFGSTISKIIQRYE